MTRTKGASNHLNQSLPLFYQLDDRRQSRLEPGSKRRIRRVADSQPNDDWRFSLTRLRRTRRKIFILGQNNSAGRHRMHPDRLIRCVAHANILHMLRLVSCLTQPARQRRRQLCINDKLHLAIVAVTTPWFTAAAAYSSDA